MMHHGIDLDTPTIREFCRKWRIRELSVFGSILRDDFRSDSDVDFLFALESAADFSFGQWLDMEAELAAIIGRKVELVPRRSIEESDNPYRKRHILQSAEPIYGIR